MFENVIVLWPETSDPAEWAGACEEAVGGLSALLLAAGRRPTGLGVCRLLDAVPATPDGLTRLSRTPDGSLLARTLAACQSGPGDRQAVVAAGIRQLVFQPPERRALLEASIRGVFLGHTLAR